MAIEALCPICGAVYTLRNELQGKSVRCKKCEHTFTVSDLNTFDIIKGEDENPKEGNPSRPGSTPLAFRRSRDDDDEVGRSKRRRYHDDQETEDNDQKPRRRKSLHEQVRPRSPQPTGMQTWMYFVAGGALMGLLLICGGFFYFLYAVKTGAQHIAQEMRVRAEERKQQAKIPGAIPELAPVRQPGTLDEALQKLNGPTPDKRAAAGWLARTPLDPARQAEVARALDPLLSDPDAGVRSEALHALTTWATRDNAASVLGVLKENHPGLTNPDKTPRSSAAVSWERSGPGRVFPL